MANALVLYMLVFHRFTRVAWGAFVPVDYATPRPGFQPWENRAWWWSRFKEPPERCLLVISVFISKSGSAIAYRPAWTGLRCARLPLRAQ